MRIEPEWVTAIGTIIGDALSAATLLLTAKLVWPDIFHGSFATSVPNVPTLFAVCILAGSSVAIVALNLRALMLVRSSKRDPAIAKTDTAAKPGPHIHISGNGTPVMIRISEALVSFSVFTSSPVVLTFVELRLGSILVKESFQESIAAFEPRFISLSRTLSPDEMAQFKQQIKQSQTVQVTATAKFGPVHQNFEFSTIPYFLGQPA